MLLWAATVGILIGSLAASLGLGNEINKLYDGEKIDYQDGINSGLAGELYLGLIPAVLLTFVFLHSRNLVPFDAKILAAAAMTVLTALAGSGIRIGLSEHYKSREGFHPRMSTTTLAIGASEGAATLAIGFIVLRNARNIYEYVTKLTKKEHNANHAYQRADTGAGGLPTVTEEEAAVERASDQGSAPNSGRNTPIQSWGSGRAATDAATVDPLKKPLLQDVALLL